MNNQVMVYLLVEIVLFFMLIIALFIVVEMIIKWDFSSFRHSQFILEKKAYLVSTILLFVFIAKFFISIYFVFTIDALSVLLPGAMCAAGVISANDYGMWLLLLKLVILFFLLLWMAVNRFDMEAKDYPLFRFKQWIFVVIFILVSIEMYLDISYFTNINIRVPVSCCSSLYGQLEGSNPLPFGLDIKRLLILFYASYIILIFSLWLKQRVASIILSMLFVYIAYYSVVYFFGTYIYQLPTHKCPFCMMQKEYYFVGYLVWGSLFMGVFQSIIASFLSLFTKRNMIHDEKRAIILISIFVIVCSAYVVFYYMKNGVLL